MYNALILPDVPGYDNKKIWKMKIPLKNKKIAWYLRRGVILLKIILLSEIGMVVKHVLFVQMMRQ
jgi:hypothetical protein